MNNKPNIFDYLDYRKYLTDYYTFMKKNTKGFTYARFSEIAGLKSPNYLKRIMDGEFRLSKNNTERVASGCGLNKSETNYFALLVDFNDEKSLKVKNQLIKKLSTISRRVIKKELTGDQYKVLSKWYYLVVRNMVNLKDFKYDKKWVAKKLHPFITPSQAEEALTLLLELGLIQFDQGKVVQASKHQASSDEVQNLAVRNYHSQMIPVAIEALRAKSIKQREIRSTTMGVTQETALKLKGKIKDFFNELVDTVAEEDKGKTPDDVWQLNLQFFNFTGKDS